jgi:purine-binding chemotaxis protein CheW
MDTKARLGMTASAHSNEGPARDNKARVIVLEAQGESVGLMVDEVMEVLRCDEGALQAPRTVLDSSAGHFLAAVLDLEGRLVLVLDLDRLVEGAAEAA